MQTDGSVHEQSYTRGVPDVVVHDRTGILTMEGDADAFAQLGLHAAVEAQMDRAERDAS